MSNNILHQILPILHQIKDDDHLMVEVLSFLHFKILPKIKQEKADLPEKYEVMVKDIAENLLLGTVTFINKDTLEIEQIPEVYLDGEDFEMVTGEKDPYERNFEDWENVIQISLMDSSQSYRVMENFANQLSNEKARNILIDILNKPKPFAHFNNYIHQSSFRQDWFAFQNAAYEEYVRECIWGELDED